MLKTNIFINSLSKFKINKNLQKQTNCPQKIKKKAHTINIKFKTYFVIKQKRKFIKEKYKTNTNLILNKKLK